MHLQEPVHHRAQRILLIHLARSRKKEGGASDELDEHLELVDELLRVELRLRHRPGGDDAVDHEEGRLVVEDDLPQEGDQPFELVLLEWLVTRDVRKGGADARRIEKRLGLKGGDHPRMGLGQ